MDEIRDGILIRDLEIRQRFAAVEREIRMNPENYREAGAWMDWQFTVESYWSYIQMFLSCAKDAEKDGYDRYNGIGGVGEMQDQACLKEKEYSISDEIAYLEMLLKHRRGYTTLVGFLNGWDRKNRAYEHEEYLARGELPCCALLDMAYFHVLEVWRMSAYVSLEFSREVYLLTWLLTDPDTDRVAFWLTRFQEETWFFNREGACISLRRSSYAEWIECLEAAKLKIDTEYECAAGAHTTRSVPGRKGGLPERCDLAYRSFEYAEHQQGRKLTYKEAYAYLREHGARGYSLPMNMDRWARYVREGRRFYNDQRNRPRAGRGHGKSIVQHDKE